MAIRDLLWACPECGRVGGVGLDDVCVCGASFKRGAGASIVAASPDGRTVSRSPAEWLALLPEPATLLPAESDGSDEPVRSARVIAREALGYSVVRWRREYLNRVERYGAPHHATLTLRAQSLDYHPDGGTPQAWLLDDMTAIQASSSALQVKVQNNPLVSCRFTDDSVFLWEMLLRAALRTRYRRTGQGEIAEFQPRIVTR